MQPIHLITKRLPRKRFKVWRWTVKEASEYVAWFRIDHKGIQKIQFTFIDGLYRQKLEIYLPPQGVGGTVSVKSKKSILRTFNKCEIQTFNTKGHGGRRYSIGNCGKFEDLDNPVTFMNAAVKLAESGTMK